LENSKSKFDSTEKLLVDSQVTYYECEEEEEYVEPLQRILEIEESE
jgi:hypothetical protein